VTRRAAILRIRIEFDDDRADAEGIARGLDKVLESYKDLFEDYGNVMFGECEEETERWKPTPKDPALCAVVGCLADGHDRDCPYDGASHHHGRIHYTYHPRFAPESTLEFEPIADGWYRICPEHGAQIEREIAAHEATKTK